MFPFNNQRAISCNFWSDDDTDEQISITEFAEFSHICQTSKFPENTTGTSHTVIPNCLPNWGLSWAHGIDNNGIKGFTTWNQKFQQQNVTSVRIKPGAYDFFVIIL